MTDSDPRISRRYAALEREEPSAALDATILHAAREAARPRLRRWYVPVSLAAVLVLSVTVVLQVEQEQPGVANLSSDAAPAARTEAPKEEKAAAERPLDSRAGAAQRGAVVGVERPKPPPQPMSQPKPAPRAFAADPAPLPEKPVQSVPQAVLPQDAQRRDEAPQPESAARSPAPAAAMLHSKQVEDTPQRWLDRIAEMRKQGKHDEADNMLAEFKRIYPAYRIPDEIRAKVEKPQP